ncbi:MAG TPA: arginine--tRNA ligase [Alphaproteobacteria bacterium]|nr:arginine--tRNA ligase [Alphaproteobacteria bacterium]
MGNSLYQNLRAGLMAALESLKASGALPSDISFANVVLETPRDATHGDFATNAAMVLAKAAAQSPQAIAQNILPHLQKLPQVKTAEVAGPGFINIFVHDADLFAQAQSIPQLKNAYGKLDLSGGQKALVEYVSINPTGPIHVGHGRNAVFGDAIANLLEKAGYPVYREYLMNDAGGQIRVLVRSLHARYLQLFGQQVEVPADGYPGEYVIDIAQKLKDLDGDKWLKVTDDEELFQGLRKFAVDACMDMIKPDIKTMGITFDNYFSEWDMHQTSRMPEAVKLLRDKGYVFEGTLPPPKGKEVKDYRPVELTLFKATAFGLEEDQPIYKRNGEPTYFGQDIAYHYDKLQRGYQLLVTVIGAAQAGSFRPLEKAIEALTGEKGHYHPVPYELVKVLRDGQPVKLSKRAGNIVLLSDVLAETGADAFRFTMLTVKPTTLLTFDLAKAVAKNMENPVFYVQYAHARLCSVFRQQAELGLTDLPGLTPQTVTLTPASRAVLQMLVQYPLVIELAAKALEPHRLATYAHQLAGAIHHWYAAEKWLNPEDKAATASALAVAQAAQTVIADALALCGVSAPQSM